jgi:IMP dehydrogenase
MIKFTDGLTFDDVLLAPKGSSIYSRKNVDLTANLFKDNFLACPIISANMDTVTEGEMAFTMHSLGGLGIIHRFLEPQLQKQEVMNQNGHRILAIGVKPSDIELVRDARSRIDGVLIDVAHGHSERVIELIRYLKKEFPMLPVIAGNVATFDGAMALIEAGASSIKVGVGPGSVCTTRIVTGCGVPQLTAIMEVRRAIDCADTYDHYEITLIADGGIRTSGDIVKALAAGANTVMVGSLFSGTDETPGVKIQIDGKDHKIFRGMASKNAQRSIGVDRAAEGVEVNIPCKGSVIPIFNELVDGIRSGLSYLNCHNLSELHETEIEMIRMSHAGHIESHPHATRK